MDEDDAVNDYGFDDGARDAPPVPHPDETEAKRLKATTYDLKWVEQLQADANIEANEMKHLFSSSTM